MVKSKLIPLLFQTAIPLRQNVRKMRRAIRLPRGISCPRTVNLQSGTQTAIPIIAMGTGLRAGGSPITMKMVNQIYAEHAETYLRDLSSGSLIGSITAGFVEG